MMIHGVRPWDSLDASCFLYENGRWVASDVSTYDAQAQIELCLRCPYADECTDCVSGREPGKRGRKRKDSTDAERLLGLGASISVVASATGLSAATVKRVRRRMKQYA